MAFQPKGQRKGESREDYLARRREEGRRWREKHPDYFKQWNEKNPGYHRRRHEKDREDNPYKVLFRKKRWDACRRKIPFTLVYEEIDWPEVCPVLGIPLVYQGGRGSQQPDSVSFDRIDPAGGYTPENTIITSWRANKLKSDATPEELQALAKFYGGKDAKWHAIGLPRSSE